MKLSKTQQEIVALMEQGWELCRSTSMDGRTWIQENGCGRGGKTKEIRINTVYALHKANRIVCVKGGFPTSHYRLVKNEKPGD